MFPTENTSLVSVPFPLGLRDGGRDSLLAILVRLLVNFHKLKYFFSCISFPANHTAHAYTCTVAEPTRIATGRDSSKHRGEDASWSAPMNRVFTVDTATYKYTHRDVIFTLNEDSFFVFFLGSMIRLEGWETMGSRRLFSFLPFPGNTIPLDVGTMAHRKMQLPPLPVHHSRRAETIEE